MKHQPSAINHIVILAGGVGGSKLVDGFARLDPRPELTVIGNTGDDIERHGLWISPDLDIVTYTLAGVVDPGKGWGFKDETFHTLEMLGRLGEDTWMNLGDKDLATHVLRTNLRNRGVRATEIARRIAGRLGVDIPILPPTDDYLQTRVLVPEGWINFQEFYLKERCKPKILDVRFDGASEANATPEVLEAVASADLLVFAPSNPIASIGPILAVPGIHEAIASTAAFRVAVSPLVGGRSLKGPSDRMMKTKGFAPDASGVAEVYRGLLDLLVVDEQDQHLAGEIEQTGTAVHITNTVMKSRADNVELARELSSAKVGGALRAAKRSV